MDKKRYEVWMAFENHLGELNDKTVIAVFYSKIRAMDYVKFCKRDTVTLSAKFGIDTRG